MKTTLDLRRLSIWLPIKVKTPEHDTRQKNCRRIELVKRKESARGRQKEEQENKKEAQEKNNS